MTDELKRKINKVDKTIQFNVLIARKGKGSMKLVFYKTSHGCSASSALNRHRQGGGLVEHTSSGILGGKVNGQVTAEPGREIM